MLFVVPQPLWLHVLELGCIITWAGNLGNMKTLNRIGKRFTGKGCTLMSRHFAKYQKTGGKVAEVPLHPLPVIDVPF